MTTTTDPTVLHANTTTTVTCADRADGAQQPTIQPTGQQQMSSHRKGCSSIQTRPTARQPGPGGVPDTGHRHSAADRLIA